jgi:hypothetical protein
LISSLEEVVEMASLIIYRGLTREGETGSEIWTDGNEIGVEFTLPIPEIEEKEKLIELTKETFGNLARRLAYFINSSSFLLRSYPELFFLAVTALDKAIDDVSETILEFVKKQ